MALREEKSSSSLLKERSSIKSMNLSGFVERSSISLGIREYCDFFISISLSPSSNRSFARALTVADLPVPASP